MIPAETMEMLERESRDRIAAMSEHAGSQSTKAAALNACVTHLLAERNRYKAALIEISKYGSGAHTTVKIARAALYPPGSANDGEVTQ